MPCNIVRIKSIMSSNIVTIIKSIKYLNGISMLQISKVPIMLCRLGTIHGYKEENDRFWRNGTLKNFSRK